MARDKVRRNERLVQEILERGNVVQVDDERQLDLFDFDLDKRTECSVQGQTEEILEEKGYRIKTGSRFTNFLRELID